MLNGVELSMIITTVFRDGVGTAGRGGWVGSGVSGSFTSGDIPRWLIFHYIYTSSCVLEDTLLVGLVRDYLYSISWKMNNQSVCHTETSVPLLYSRFRLYQPQVLDIPTRSPFIFLRPSLGLPSIYMISCIKRYFFWSVSKAHELVWERRLPSSHAFLPLFDGNFDRCISFHYYPRMCYTPNGFYAPWLFVQSKSVVSL